ncbi:MAG: metallophosphoesterase, partial [Chloroflexota bacterium]
WVEGGDGGFWHPDDRTLVFIGDLADRGPGSVDVWELALAMLDADNALFVPGNHEAKLARFLQGRSVRITHGVEVTVQQFRRLPDQRRAELDPQIIETILEAPPYLILDGANLVVAHAGLEDWMIGDVDRRISIFARYGEPTGEYTGLGLPIRRDWVQSYRGSPLIVYGHTPVDEPEFRHNTINIDQGCCFGGALTALRYPELEIVSIPAKKTYATPTMSDRVADRLSSVGDG